MTNFTKALHCRDQFSLHPARAILCVLPRFLDNSSNGKKNSFYFSIVLPDIILQPSLRLWAHLETLLPYRQLTH